MKVQGRIRQSLIMAILLFGFAPMAQAYVDAVPGEYVVKLKDPATVMSKVTLSQALGAEVVDYISPESQAIVVRRAIGEDKGFALHLLNNNPYVEYAEPNYIYRIDVEAQRALVVPNDPDLDKLWGLINSGQTVGRSVGVSGIDVDAAAAWGITTGSRDVVVAVIDTGINYNHPDLAPNMWVNEAERDGLAGVDDDGNGFIDDIYGYNFVSNTGDPLDDHGHGSHCAGTIGANGNDEFGIVGVAWQVRFMGIKFLSRFGGGSLDNAIRSIDYATLMGAHISNNSWGGGSYSELLKESIERARDAGQLFVAAAGNERRNNDTRPAYPASYEVDNIISVAAIDNRGNLANFSNFGQKSVHVAAPGVDIYSTILGERYASWSGTSMAAPHVSGIAALLYSHFPEITLEEARERIISTAKPLASLNDRVSSGGIASAYRALTHELPVEEEE